MKLRTRLLVAFFTIVLIPIILSGTMVMILGKFSLSTIEKTYGIQETSMETLSSSVQILSRVTEKNCAELCGIIHENPDLMEDASYLEDFNAKLEEKGIYLLVRKDNTMIYIGEEGENTKSVIEHLPAYDGVRTASENGIYLGGDAHAMVKQIDFLYTDGDKGSAFIVADVANVIPEVEELMVDMLFGIAFVLIITALVLVLWIYRSVMQPLAKMQTAAKNIRDGNLDFEIYTDAKDEFGDLSRDLEDMRKRLKDSAEEKILFDKQSKELISNISHDLKTPVTTIKGYAEGIIDGVADTPEKVGRYVRTIYNKASEMDTLINELTLYSKIDTNRIPYNFNILSVNDYFNDCAEDLSMELDARNVQFGFFNYVAEDVKIIADAEQISRVIHNIINNSVKYMDKEYGRINLRVKDVGDFVQIEIEDNGKGIAAKELPNIFDRFYRTDASRNSTRGGSGIGLSIVKKIVEEHGGKIWATSRENTGTTMYFVLRKYQEVPNHE